MSIRCQAGFKATAFELLKHIQIGNLQKKKKMKQSTALISLFKSTVRVRKISF